MTNIFIFGDRKTMGVELNSKLNSNKLIKCMTLIRTLSHIIENWREKNRQEQITGL